MDHSSIKIKPWMRSSKISNVYRKLNHLVPTAGYFSMRAVNADISELNLLLTPTACHPLVDIAYPDCYRYYIWFHEASNSLLHDISK